VLLGSIKPLYHLFSVLTAGKLSILPRRHRVGSQSVAVGSGTDKKNYFQGLRHKSEFLIVLYDAPNKRTIYEQ
jgi:hypothetical protein